jgi:hypothetical protein
MWAQDAPDYTYTPEDFGIVDPNAAVIIPDEIDDSTDDAESGAAALMSAATVLAAILMF